MIVHQVTVENNHNENKVHGVFNNTKDTQGNLEVTKYILTYNHSVINNEDTSITRKTLYFTIKTL